MSSFSSLKNVITSATIPEWAQWLAMDEDGSLWAYQVEPHRHDHGWYENEIGNCYRVGRLTCDIPWRNCLWKINEMPIDSSDIA